MSVIPILWHWWKDQTTTT